MTDVTSSQFVIYQSEDGQIKLDVRFVDETVWLTQQQVAELFQTSRTNVVEHIQHIYEEGELESAATCREFRQVAFLRPLAGFTFFKLRFVRYLLILLTKEP